jgi:hypothetical protein
MVQFRHIDENVVVAHEKQPQKRHLLFSFAGASDISLSFFGRFNCCAKPLTIVLMPWECAECVERYDALFERRTRAEALAFVCACVCVRTCVYV